jgi:surface polysaccharide O-acyltransferase-like enzyme
MGSPMDGTAETTEDTSKQIRKENHFLRTMCAVILIFITYTHYYVPYEYNSIIFGMGRFAIPIFFLISGYYCFSKDGHSENRLAAKTIHIGILIVILKMTYLLLDCIYYSCGVIDLNYLITAFVLFEPTTSHAWFIYALFLTYVFFWLLHKKGVDFSKTYFLAPLIIIVDLLFSEFLPLFGFTDISGYCTVEISEKIYPFIAMPFFIIGYWYHRNKHEVDAKLSNLALELLIVAFIVISFAEVMINLDIIGSPRSNLFVGSVAVAVFSFIATFRLPENRGRSRVLEYMGRNMMPWLFTMYPACVFFVKTIVLDQWAGTEWIYYGIGPFLAIALNIAVSFLIYKGMVALSHSMKGRKSSVTSS